MHMRANLIPPKPPTIPQMRAATALTLLMMSLWGFGGGVQAADTPAPGKVVVSGTVPDETTRQLVLTRAREVFGVDRVVDQIGVANLVAPPNWSKYVQSIISPELKQVSRGQININGNVIDLKGEVGNEAVRQQIVSDMSTRLNSTYTVNNGLRVGAAGQDQVDLALANRTIEFETGNATLTGSGRQVLDLLAPVLLRLPGRSFEVTGHTDALGSRPQNIALSAARADAVKRYLLAKGIAADSVTTAGVGPDRPLVSNDTAEGRSRNRRIELRVVK
jgi:OmpA-OmpF porin, OOP family